MADEGDGIGEGWDNKEGRLGGSKLSITGVIVSILAVIMEFWRTIAAFLSLLLTYLLKYVPLTTDDFNGHPLISWLAPPLLTFSLFPSLTASLILSFLPDLSKLLLETDKLFLLNLF